MTCIAAITRERYIPSPRPHVAAVLSAGYTGTGLRRRESLSEEATSDWCERERIRRSDDNGRTWSDWQPHPEEHPTQGEFVMEEIEFARAYDPAPQRMLRMLFQRILKGAPDEALAQSWQGKETYWDHMFWQASDDDGLTWGEKHQLAYEDGPVFDEANWGNPEYLARNTMYGGYNLAVLADGGVAYSGTIPVQFGNERGEVERVAGVICLIGAWDDARRTYDWEASPPVAVSKRISSRGLMEPCIVELSNGNLMLEMRGSNTDITPGRKWMSVSRDRGHTWSAVTDLRYDDGGQFYAPSTFARMLRSNKTGKLYWIGNISTDPPQGNSPRYPLYIAEVDEELPALRRDTLTIIDDYDPHHDTPLLQLSNFSAFENRETRDLELYLTRYGERGDGRSHTGDFWTADAYKYVVRLA
jgi:hypothetical protein